jgi:hypothetical protein
MIGQKVIYTDQIRMIYTFDGSGNIERRQFDFGTHPDVYSKSVIYCA